MKEHALIKHKEIILNTKHSALRNSFIDLYPSDDIEAVIHIQKMMNPI